mmetsp:Transcript_29014/g.50082  ORF Transcript_29014/g.50082 Transcript_29014/m.50082 type:complete len:244 (-) Transcript_29014:286-1017(-)
MPSAAGRMHSPVTRSRPMAAPSFSCSSWSEMIESCTSKPEFSARTFGMMSMASAYACTPSLALPVTVPLKPISDVYAAVSKAPAPATTALSSIAFLAARRPSRTASLIWSMVWVLGPLMRMVHDLAALTSSMNVNLSSPSCSSYTLPAQPSTLGSRSISELTGVPPHARVTRSMLRRLARRTAKMPSLASMSSDIGSMPFWLIITKLWPSVQTCLLSSMKAPTFSSVNLRSDSTSFCLSSAFE